MPSPSPTLAATATLSDHRDTRTAAMEVVDRLIDSRSGSCDLLLVFGSFHHRAAFGEATAILRQSMRPRVTVGVTAEAVVGPRDEREGAAGLSALSLSLPGIELHPVRFDILDGPPAVWESGFVHERLGLGADRKATFLFADPFSSQSPNLMTKLNAVGSADAAARGRAGAATSIPPIVGGLASGSSQPGANVLVLDDELYASGAVGVSLAGPVRVDALVSPGCRPIGRPHVITKATGNVLEQLGGRPAIEVLQETLSALPEAEQPPTRDGVILGLAVSEYRERFGRGDFLLRGVLGADPKRGALVIGDLVRTGRTVQFHLRDRRAAEEDLELLLMREQLRDPAVAVFLTTCNSRGERLFGFPHHDARRFAETLDDPPLAGFFAAGEFGPIGDQSWLHGHSVCAGIVRSG